MQLARTVACLGIAGGAALLWLAVPPLFGQQRPPTGQPFPSTYRAARAADGHPDLNGIWQAFVTANWDLQDHEAQPGPHPELTGAYGAGPAGQSIVEGGEIPYKPEALAKKKANFENRTDGRRQQRQDVARARRSGNEVLHARRAARHLHAVPVSDRAGDESVHPDGVQFTSATRIVRMDWKQEAPTDSWMGWSRGRWEGDTLVVDVTGQREETWFDRAGDFHSDALHVVERYTPVSPYHMMYEATIEDPKVFTRPWKISFPLYRRMEKNVQLLEFKCVPFTEELLFGKFRKQAAR